jgi:agmatinase
MIPPGLQEQMDGPSYLGPATFMKLPFLSEPSQLDEVKPQAAIIGAPWDDSVSSRPGARFGPRAVRTANSITLPSATAVADARGRGEVGLVHFDAHADTGDHAWGNLLSHGAPMRRLIESGAIPGKNFVQLGLRGYWPGPETLAWMRDQGMRWHLMDELVDRGTDIVVREALLEAQDGPRWIYLSVDIDVLDPGFAPGTGTPEPGGMNPTNLLRAIRRVVLETNVIALDVVEVSPPYDHAEITAQNANRVILEVIAALAVKARRIDQTELRGDHT